MYFLYIKVPITIFLRPLDNSWRGSGMVRTLLEIVAMTTGDSKCNAE